MAVPFTGCILHGGMVCFFVISLDWTDDAGYYIMVFQWLRLLVCMDAKNLPAYTPLDDECFGRQDTEQYDHCFA